MIEFQEKKEEVKLFPHDYLMKYLILPIFPRFVLPNHITIFRFLATPFVFLLIWLENYKWGIPFFIFIALTDAIDGSMARVRNQITKWGSHYDPIADKVLIVPILILLIFRHLNFYLAISMITLEFIHAIGYLIFKKWEKIGLSNFWGKSKMIMQVVSISLLLIFLMNNNYIFLNLAQITLAIAILFAITGLISHGIKLKFKLNVSN